MSVTDDFNRASLGTSWTNQALNGSVPGIISNAAWNTTGSSFAMMFWSAHAWNAAHHSKIKMLGTNYVGAGVRHSGSGAGTNAYVYFSHGSLQKFVNALQSVLASAGTIAPPGAAGDFIELDVTGNSTIGNTLQTTKNGVVGTAAPPDSALNAGSPGIAWYSNTAGGDDWIGTGEVPAAIATYTLSAGIGSFSATGTAATLRANRRLVAGSGSYSATATAAQLAVGRRLLAASGSYTTIGTPATLTRTTADLHHYVLSAGPGVFTVTGTAALLRAARRLAVSSGDFLWSGTPAALYRSTDVIPDELVAATFEMCTAVALDAEVRVTVAMTAER